MPVTSIVGSNVLISWSSPNNNGDPITAYLIEFLTSDGLTWATETTDCDGTTASVISSTSC